MRAWNTLIMVLDAFSTMELINCKLPPLHASTTCNGFLNQPLLDALMTCTIGNGCHWLGGFVSGYEFNEMGPSIPFQTIDKISNWSVCLFWSTCLAAAIVLGPFFFIHSEVRWISVYHLWPFFSYIWTGKYDRLWKWC